MENTPPENREIYRSRDFAKQAFFTLRNGTSGAQNKNLRPIRQKIRQIIPQVVGEMASETNFGHS